MNAWNQEREQVIKELESDRERGLDAARAKELLETYGRNQLTEKKKKTFLHRFLEQFRDVMVLILLAAAFVSFVTAVMERDKGAFFEPLLILLIVVLNAFVGVLQENKAERSLEALREMAAPHARVIRNGKEQVLDAAELVPGDIIRLEAGDFVPADGRLLSAYSLKVEESPLTGESLAAEKNAEEVIPEDAPLGDRVNCVFSGCSVLNGTASAIVTHTGMKTEMGKIAGLLEKEEEHLTPLQQRLAQLGKYLGILALGICGIIFVLGLINGMPVLEIFMTAVSLAVSAIPEGLPVIVTVVLSLGVERMAKRNAIVKKLPAVETLGCTSVICSDKTGTLTQNKMTLTSIWTAGEEQEEITNHNSEPARELLAYGALCSNGSLLEDADGEVLIGDPTETSILAAAYRNGLKKEALEKRFPREGEIPFDSDRKLMSVLVKTEKGYRVITKGAFDMIAMRCMGESPNRDEKREEILDRGAAAAARMSSKALRVLAIAYKDLEQLPKEMTSETVERDLTFLGLVGMIDPPREEAKEAVATCKKAGIRPIMITGDHVVTASVIAEQLGILNPGQEAITGAELEALSEEEFDRRLKKISVYARVSPQDKIRVVKAWQKKGRIVSMTGDGVNDAPALKAADIGCAMGITGTDVAKSAADMTLQDDNFATIVAAVREGRGIYNNIRKTVGFLLGTNIGEVLVVFFAMIFWKVSPFLPMQLLWINLITDSLPAIALGMEPVEDEVMEMGPRPRDEGIFAHGLGIQVVLQGIMFAAISLAAFEIGCCALGALEGGRTMAFFVLAYSQVIHAFNMRSRHSLFHIGFFTNPKLNLAAVSSAALMALILFVSPLSGIFGLMRLPLWLYGIGIFLALIPLGVLEAAKAGKLVK